MNSTIELSLICLPTIEFISKLIAGFSCKILILGLGDPIVRHDPIVPC